MTDVTDIDEFSADDHQLRRRLQDYAGRAVVPDDAWDKLQARIAAPRKRSAVTRRRTVLALTAAAIVVVIAAFALVVHRDDSSVKIVDDPTTTTTEPDDADSTTTTSSLPTSSTSTPPRETPTGDLPTGGGPGGDQGPGAGSSGESGTGPSTPGTGPGTTSTTETTIPSGPEPPTYQFSSSTAVLTMGDSITIQSVSPCVHSSNSVFADVEVLYEGLVVQSNLLSVDANGEWLWAFGFDYDRVGVYSIRVQCQYYDVYATEYPYYKWVFDYEPQTFTLVAPEVP